MNKLRKLLVIGLIAQYPAIFWAQTPFFSRIDLGALSQPSTMQMMPNGHILMTLAKPAPVLIELDADGTLLGSMRLQAIGNRQPELIDVQPLASGDFICLINLPENLAPNQEVSHLFIKRYSGSFQEIWSIYLGKGAYSVTETCGIAADAAGNFYAWLGVSADLNRSVLRFTADGTVLWKKRIPLAFTGAEPMKDGGLLLSFLPEPDSLSPAIMHLNAAGMPVQAVRVHSTINQNGLQMKVFPGGDVLINWIEKNNVKWSYARLSPTLNPITAWSSPLSGTWNQDNLVLVQDALFYSFIFDGSNGSTIFRMNGQGDITKAVYAPGLIQESFFSAKPVPSGADGFVAGSIHTADFKELLILQLDSTLSLPHCTLLEYACKKNEPTTVILAPTTIPVSDAAPLQLVQPLQWENYPIQVQPFCPETIVPTAAFHLPDTVCQGTSLRPDSLNNFGAYNWHWSFSGPDSHQSSTGIKPLVTFDEPGLWVNSQVIGYFGCLSDSFSLQVEVLPLPELTLGPDTLLCKQDLYMLTAAVSNADTWVWDDQSADLVRMIDSSGLYFLEARNMQCKASDSVRVVFAYPDAAFETTDSLCPGSRLAPHPHSLDSGMTHQWNLSSGASSALETPEFQLSEPGVTLVEHVVALLGCSDSARAVVRVLDMPQVFLEPSIPLCPDSTLLLQPDTVFVGHFEWSDGYPNLSRLVEQPGLYSLAVYHGDCRAEAQTVVTPSHCVPSQLYAPNAIVPRSNGDNAVFRLFYNTGIEQVEVLEVYDRWGELVFQSFSGEGWDGRYGDRDAAPGVYVWQARLRLTEGSTTWMKGSVSVLR